MKRSLKIVVPVLAVVLGLAAWILLGLPSESSRESLGQGEGRELSDQPYIRAAHWFGEAWPVNFWHTDLESLARKHFRMMQEDGFNTVVFVVPWPGFAPDPRSGQLDEERVQRLRELMMLADEMGLMTILRISYAWDWLDRSSGERLMQLWLDEEYYRGWLAYIEALWSAVEDVPGFQFGFFSWEDLWAVTGLGNADEALRMAAAHQSGFSTWLIEEKGLDRAREAYGLVAETESEVVIPERRDPAYALFLEFVSEAWIDRFFEPARERFPKLSMEIRIDSDPIYDGERIVEWFDHRPNWELPGAEWVTLYWSPAMGGENRGETLSPETAADRLTWWLDQVAEHAGPRQIFIGQFLFEDFTPGYESNGRIPRSRIPRFLDLASGVLQGRSGGVGLWTWTDYAHGAVANPEFHAGLEGWDVVGHAVMNSNGLRMETGSSIATDLARFSYSLADQPDLARLCVRASAPEGAALKIFLDDREGQAGILEFESAEQQQRCVEHDLSARRLRLEANGELHVHAVQSDGFVQRSGIRDQRFELKEVGSAYRRLNAKLQQRPALHRPRHDDGWMGRVLYERHSLQPESRVLYLDTHLPENWPVSPDLRIVVNGEHLDDVPCGADAPAHIRLSESALKDREVNLHIEASEVHQPSGDARRLGCHIRDLSFIQEGGRPDEAPEL